MYQPYTPVQDVVQDQAARQPLGPVTLWRGAIVFTALHGLYNIVASWGGGLASIELRYLYELSQLASLIVAVCYLALAIFPVFTGGKRHEPRSGWLRGALAVMMLLVSLTSILLMGGGRLEMEGFFFEHLITPVFVVADFLFVGRNQLRTKWWHPLTWVVLPLIYFVFLLATGMQSYGMLFAPSSARFIPTVVGFVIAIVIVGYVLYGATKLIGLVVEPARKQAPLPAAPQGHGQPPAQGYGPPPAQGYGPPPAQGYGPPPAQTHTMPTGTNQPGPPQQ